MIVVVFLLFTFQLMCGFRILKSWVDSKLISSQQMTKIGTTALMGDLIITLFWPRGWVTLIFYVILKFLLMKGAEVLIRHYREKLFERRFSDFMTKLILKMQMGSSFRQSLGELSRQSDAFTQQILNKIVDVVTFSQHFDENHSSEFLVEVISEFKRIDQESHTALKHLRAFHRKLKKQDEFRRKSGQVTRQIRVQSAMLAVLYLATLIFVGFQFDLRRNLWIVTTSALVFIAGLVWVALGGRKREWRV